MPESWGAKRERQYEHIKDSEKKQGTSTKRAKEIAARTVNKERARSGETKSRPSRTSTRDISSDVFEVGLRCIGAADAWNARQVPFRPRIGIWQCIHRCQPLGVAFERSLKLPVLTQ